VYWLNRPAGQEAYINVNVTQKRLSKIKKTENAIPIDKTLESKLLPITLAKKIIARINRIYTMPLFLLIDFTKG
jgi:hypothetical protein